MSFSKYGVRVECHSLQHAHHVCSLHLVDLYTLKLWKCLWHNRAVSDCWILVIPAKTPPITPYVGRKRLLLLWNQWTLDIYLETALWHNMCPETALWHNMYLDTVLWHNMYLDTALWHNRTVSGCWILAIPGNPPPSYYTPSRKEIVSALWHQWTLDYPETVLWCNVYFPLI